ncbi:MAG TPA: selenocysteine-specific translation elongation factor [Acidimicrobiia bacterium]|nr:selenocysteine-specific translation elongation factor [Acidimicrobiia bacterium]
MPVVGTAGHVDHGKSTLILGLTGRDPDRWDEEKRRGLTIDLGFAWANLPGNVEVSFVDVPGHERFIKNMLAGVEAIDAALFVVAADEGWAAQSEEHLAVLDLLEVRHGVVALTKIDRVDDETVELAREEVIERLAGSSLAGSPVVAVSATQGVGMEELATKLAHAAQAGTPETSGRPRMWIDRSFSIVGAGTVVTGTLLGGELEVGMTVDVWLAGGGQARGRIRSLEVHEKKLERTHPHRRVAVNLVGVERSEIERGSMLGVPGHWLGSQRFLVEFRVPRGLGQLGARGSFSIHIGSGAWPVRLRQLDAGLALCDLSTKLCLQIGDRFILRDTGRREVIAGGRVIDPDPPRKGAALREAARILTGVAEVTPHEAAQTLLAVRRSAPATVLSAHASGGHPKDAFVIGEHVLHPEEKERLLKALIAAVTHFHSANPLRPGVSAPVVAATLGTLPEVVEALAPETPELTIKQGLIAHANHASGDPSSHPSWLQARAILDSAGLSVPRIADLGLDRELFHALVRSGEVVKISEDLAYLPGQVEELLAHLASLPPDFTVSDFRDQAGISRKYAVPFLEWTDAAERTVRKGDVRSYRGMP